MGIGIEVTTFTSEGASESVNATMNGRSLGTKNAIITPT